MTRSLAITMLSVAASACAIDADDLAADTLLVPASIELHWSDAFNGTDDGLGAVVPIDVMVYDGLTGEPRGGIELDLQTSPGVYALTEHELVRLEPESCLDCALFWDAYRDQYYGLLVDTSDLGSARLRTDSEGLARVFVVVDSFESGALDFEPSRVHVLADAADATVLLVPR